MRFFFERESVEFVGKVVSEGEAGAAGAADVEGGAVESVAGCVAPLSSGCRSGIGAAVGLPLLPSSASLSMSSEKPISPRFRGRGPACGRDSAVEFEDAVLEDGSMTK
jgi:hypothetical protein